MVPVWCVVCMCVCVYMYVCVHVKMVTECSCITSCVVKDAMAEMNQLSFLIVSQQMSLVQSYLSVMLQVFMSQLGHFRM